MKYTNYLRFLIYGIFALSVLSAFEEMDSNTGEAITSFTQLRSQFKEPCEEQDSRDIAIENCLHQYDDIGTQVFPDEGEIDID